MFVTGFNRDQIRLVASNFPGTTNPSVNKGQVVKNNFAPYKLAADNGALLSVTAADTPFDKNLPGSASNNLIGKLKSELKFLNGGCWLNKK